MPPPNQINKTVPITSLPLGIPKANWLIPAIGYDEVSQIYRPYKITVSSIIGILALRDVVPVLDQNNIFTGGLNSFRGVVDISPGLLTVHSYGGGNPYGTIIANANANVPPPAGYINNTVTMRETSEDGKDQFHILEAFGYNNIHNSTPHLVLRSTGRAGSMLNPSPVGADLDNYGPYLSSGDFLGTIAFTGAAPGGSGVGSGGPTQMEVVGRACIEGRPTELWTATARGALLGFVTTPNGGADSRYVGFFTDTGKLLLDCNSKPPIPTLNNDDRLQVTNLDNHSTAMYIDAVGSVSGVGCFPYLVLRGARGTMDAPSASKSGDILGFATALGYGATEYNYGAGAQIEFIATQDFTNAHMGEKIALRTTANDTNVIVDRWFVEQDGGLYSPGAAGGSKGSGTVNAAALFINGVPAVPGAQASFRANKNGANQPGIPASTFTKLTFTNDVSDIGSFYDAVNSRWVPPVGVVLLAAQAMFTVGVVDQAQFIVSIYKNGVQIFAGTDVASGTAQAAPNTFGFDNANGTDYYEVFVYGDGAGAKTVDGSFFNTYFHGAFLG